LSWSLWEGRDEVAISLDRAHTHKREHNSSFHPAFPCCLVRSDNEQIGIPDEWKPEQQRFFGKFLQPAFVRKLRVLKTKLGKTLCLSIDECSHTKFLGESAKLADRCGTFYQVDEMSLDSSLREKAKSLARISAFLDSKDLYFQCRSGLSRSLKE
jgi:hypothetical protein